MKIDGIDRDLFALFGLIAVVTLGVAWVLSHGVLHWGDIVSSYFQIGFLSLLVGLIPRVVFPTFQASRTGKSPLAEVYKSLTDPKLWVWLAVPGFIAPIFMAAFTITKTLIGIKLGFTWDDYFAELDRVIFGTDPWRYTHAVFGTEMGSKFLQFWYVGWGVPVAFSMPLVVVLAGREHAAKFLLAMFLTWAMAGLCLAALFASAGPCFAGEFNPVLKERFAPLNDQLTLLLKDGPIQMTQHYLAKYWNAKVAVKGGGISAFPSVHVAVAVLYVIASWRKPLLRYASLFFAMTIWIGSIHFGYHYAVDGIASVGIAYAAWTIASKAVAFIASRHQPAVALA
ncbi:phosphatase PAP2 family protein [Dongia deserti]|uniref:phosphatase PAP2 family protein n=1 Tax=Dongia deserti TaxID=2268030 RepID=UPI000E652323|nr:phosphatase PAP2 family protein [Dongia deserti]